MVKRNIAELKEFDFLTLRSSQQRLHTGNQFHDGKRLANIVVRTIVQSLDHVHLRRLGRHHNDWKTLGGRIFPKLLYNIIAALIGKHHIQKHQIRNDIIQLLVEIFRLFKGADHIVAVLKRDGLDFPYVFIILHNINQRHIISS